MASTGTSASHRKSAILVSPSTLEFIMTCEAQGGFVIEAAQAEEWANRILRASRPDATIVREHSARYGAAVVQMIQERLEQLSETDDLMCRAYERKSHKDPYSKYIIVTQSVTKHGIIRKGSQLFLDKEDFPVSGPIEERTKQILKDEGIEHSEYITTGSGGYD
ncbi:hypothetical protein BDY19DRAFT_180543 [Irpex rosettiformis]|uniref:Uncharacterized protein n=1 Tax=Irpex rosettiformis TaxID=378272 RepID=A0ACB8U384_9APHY|nr:hypothetical protein BDY19DRAFT_180543 [Irpex rosettiformis]